MSSLWVRSLDCSRWKHDLHKVRLDDGALMPGTVILGLQWGDEGKGKIVDFLIDEDRTYKGQKFYAVARFNGGPNAGHTVRVKDKTYKFHQLPSGVLHDNVQNVIGNGCVIEPAQLDFEYAELHNAGIEPFLIISERAHLILSWHVLQDMYEGQLRRAAADLKASEKGSLTSSTTGRGIGPCYADKASRIGIRVEDLSDYDRLKAKLAFLASLKEPYLKLLGRPADQEPESVERLADGLFRFGQFWEENISDTGSFLNDALKEGKRVLFEGAQSAHLDTDLGIYPYSTSSTCVASGASSGTGTSPKYLNEIVGVVKAYTSRSGDGAFPTEIRGDEADDLRKFGNEYGTTTGKPRRVGFLDLVMVKTAIEMNGVDWIALTRMDTLAEFARSQEMMEIPVCTEYRFKEGPIRRFPTMKMLPYMTPIYEYVKGYDEYLRFVEHKLGVPIRLVGTGPERDDIEVRNPAVFGE